MTPPDTPTPDSDEGGCPPWLSGVVQEVILLAMDRRGDDVADRLERIANDGGPEAMFSACMAWATASGSLSGITDAVKTGGADGVALTTLSGRSPDETCPHTFAARLLACAVNEQIDTAMALFNASMADHEHHMQCVLAVVLMVAGFGRAKQEEVAAERRATRARRTQGRHGGSPRQRRPR